MEFDVEMISKIFNKAKHRKRNIKGNDRIEYTLEPADNTALEALNSIDNSNPSLLSFLIKKLQDKDDLAARMVAAQRLGNMREYAVDVIPQLEMAFSKEPLQIVFLKEDDAFVNFGFSGPDPIQELIDNPVKKEIFIALRKISPLDKGMKYEIMKIFESIVARTEAILTIISNTVAKQKNVPSNEIQKIFSEIISDNFWEPNKILIDKIQEDEKSRLVTKYNDFIQTEIDHYFGKYNLDNNSKKKLEQIALLRISYFDHK